MEVLDPEFNGAKIRIFFLDFNNSRSFRLYLLTKKSILQQVDVLLHSFKTEREVDPIIKEEIFEELE